MASLSTSRASLLVGYVYARIVGSDGSLKPSGIDLLTPCPFDEIFRAIRRISTPPLERIGVDRLVDVDVTSVLPDIWLLTDRSVKWRKALAYPPDRKDL